MKTKYVYMIVPVCGVLLFTPFYLHSAKYYDDLRAAQIKHDREAREKKAEIEAESRAQAIRENNASAERHKKEREAKAAKIQAEQEALDAAHADDQKAFNDKEKYDIQVTQLQKEIKAEKTAISGIENDGQSALKEEAALKQYVQQAEINRQSILKLLDKLAAAEKARADEIAKQKAANNS